MKRTLLCTAVLFLLASPVAATDDEPSSESKSGSAQKTSTANTEWSDHNAHDPGMAAQKGAAPMQATRRVDPSQSRVLLAPASAGLAPPCTQAAVTRARERGNDHKAGSITFGDGEHGRTPQGGQADCGDPVAEGKGQAEPEEQSGDPDEPVVTGRVVNPDDED